MAKIYYESDCNFGLLKGKKIAVIGYGSQGHAHSLNLKDSGADVTVGLYEGSKSWEKVESAGLKVAKTADAVKDAKSRAQKIAEGTDKTIGTIKTANMGVVQVLPVNSTEVSDYGTYDTGTIEKEVMITVTVLFTLE